MISYIIAHLYLVAASLGRKLYDFKVKVTVKKKKKKINKLSSNIFV